MSQMVTLRIHLDDADGHNGCLKVIPGSHQWGFLDQKQIRQINNEHSSRSCVVKAGETIMMRPLLLHASNKAVVPNHRRVVHIEFSQYQLPFGIYWA